MEGFPESFSDNGTGRKERAAGTDERQDVVTQEIEPAEERSLLNATFMGRIPQFHVKIYIIYYDVEVNR